MGNLVEDALRGPGKCYQKGARAAEPAGRPGQLGRHAPGCAAETPRSKPRPGQLYPLTGARRMVLMLRLDHGSQGKEGMRHTREEFCKWDSAGVDAAWWPCRRRASLPPLCPPNQQSTPYGMLSDCAHPATMPAMVLSGHELSWVGRKLRQGATKLAALTHESAKLTNGGGGGSGGGRPPGAPVLRCRTQSGVAATAPRLSKRLGEAGWETSGASRTLARRAYLGGYSNGRDAVTAWQAQQRWRNAKCSSQPKFKAHALLRPAAARRLPSTHPDFQL